MSPTAVQLQSTVAIPGSGAAWEGEGGKEGGRQDAWWEHLFCSGRVTSAVRESARVTCKAEPLG